MFYIVSHHPPNKGGAEIFLKEVQEWLVEDSKETTWVQSTDHVKDDATLIITSGVNQTKTATWAKKNNLPCIVLLQHWKEVYDPLKREAHPLFTDLLRTGAIVSCCSMFLRNKIQEFCNILIPRIVYPVGRHVSDYYWNGGKYIFAPNISRDKGGMMFNDLISSGIPLVGISHSNNSYTKMIREKIRGKNHIILIDSAIDRNQVYTLMSNARAVLCVNNVEETFCKVAWEAMCIGVPVLCRKHGNFPYLFGEHGNYVSCANDIVHMYRDGTLKSCDRSSMFCPLQSKAIFMGMVEDAMFSQCRNMYMGPWSDQGLGRQMQRYVRESTVTPVIFSWKCAVNKDIIFQGCSQDWVHTHVYWSEKYRETVSKEEIEAVVKEFHVDHLYVLEPANTIFDQLQGLSCKTIAIPNIETVKTCELQCYKSFDQIICHTQQCYDYFKHYASATHHPLAFNNFHGITLTTMPVKYLLLGGAKPGGRKQTERVERAFHNFDNCSLTVTWQRSTSVSQTSKNVNIITRNLSSAEVDDLYMTHDVVIVLSCQEGLGLSIIEALERGKPVIATDMAPHNEYVKHGKNGWLVKGKEIPLLHNNDPLFSGVLFDMDHLIHTIAMINNLAIIN